MGAWHGIALAVVLLAAGAPFLGAGARASLPAPAPAGVPSIGVTSHDASGLEDAPTVAIVVPEEYHIYRGPSIGVIGNASGGVAIARVEVRLNGGAWQTATGTGNWSIVLNAPSGVDLVEAQAFDDAGNSSLPASVPFMMDNAPPAIRIDSPANRTRVNTANVTVNGTASDDFRLEFLDWHVTGDGGYNRSWVSNGPFENPESWSMVVVLVQGWNRIDATALDLFRFTPAVPVYVYYDPIPPEVQIASPTDGQAFRTDTVTMAGTASDNAGVALVEVRANNGAWQGCPPPVSPWSCPVTLALGTNLLEARATDTAGGVSPIASVTVVYDTTAPIVGISSPATGALLNAASVDVSGTAYDDDRVGRVQVRRNGGAWLTAAGTVSWLLSMPLAPGVNLLEAQAVDAAGNPSAIASVSVTYDGVAPTVAFTDPASGQVSRTAAIAVRGTASDNLAVASIQVRVNGGAWKACSPPVSPWSCSVTLVEGSNLLEAQATDTAGNPSFIASVLVVYDPIAPSVAFTSPADGSVVGVALLGVAGTASDNWGLASVDVRVNGGAWQPCSPPVDPWGCAVVLASGSNLVEARATDLAGNPSAVASIAVTYDAVPPTVSIDAPTEDAMVRVAAMTVSGTAADNLAVRSVDVRVNAGPWLAASGTSAWTANLTLRPGANIVEARATDGGGTTSPLASVNVTYDDVSPVVAIAAPTEGRAFSVASITATGSASDNVVVAEVQVRVNGGAWLRATGTIAWSAPLTLAAGLNTIEAQAFDGAGNPSPLARVTVALDTTPPSLAIATPADGTLVNTASISMSGTAGDDSGIARVEWRAGGGPWQVASGTTSWSAVVPLSEGANPIEVRAVDAAGNAESAALSVTYDGIAPSVEVASPASGGTVEADAIVVSGTASDNDVVARVEVRANGGEWSPASGTSDWSATVPLYLGRNVIEVRAFDAAGNPSAVARVTVTMAPRAPAPPMDWLPITLAVFAGFLLAAVALAWRRRPPHPLQEPAPSRVTAGVVPPQCPMCGNDMEARAVVCGFCGWRKAS